jgi:hypothetical protein
VNDHYPASEKQQAFIMVLVEDRVCDRDAILNDLPFTTKKDASRIIENLLAAPKKARPARPAAMRGGNPNVADMIKSKYAVPTSELAMFSDLIGLDAMKGDLLFIEVKEYRGTIYMRRLQGAPGSFLRLRLPREAEDALAAHIKIDAYRYTRLFGEHYRCCGKCGAELTDEKSRALMLGPDCRKAFGL